MLIALWGAFSLVFPERLSAVRPLRTRSSERKRSERSLLGGIFLWLLKRGCGAVRTGHSWSAAAGPAQGYGCPQPLTAGACDFVPP
jgi:hypothetical protein